MLSHSWPVVVSVAVCAVAALIDLRTQLIPNWLTLSVLSGALLAHGFLGGIASLLLALFAAFACGLPAYFLFARGALGGGDVKLFAGLGALLGARQGLELELTAFVLVTLIALFQTAWHGRLLSMLKNSWRATLYMVAPARFAPPQAADASCELPMGGAIFAAALAVFVRSAS